MPRYTAIAVFFLVCLNPIPGFAQAPVTEAPASFPEEMDPRAERIYGGMDFLLWWLREGRVPPLLTTSSPSSAGILGKPDTQIIYGDSRLETRHQDKFNGIRFNLGAWLDDEHSLGIEGSAFFLERDSTYFKAVSDGSTVLARPFFNALTGAPSSEVIAGPGALGLTSGGINGYTRVELFGEEVNAVIPWQTGVGIRLDFLVGAHFLQMRDRADLDIAGHPVADPSTLVGLTDHFNAIDHFWGGQVGLRGEVVRGAWSLSITGEVAPGATDVALHAFGDRTFQTPFVKVVTPYGLAVQPSNSGRFSRVEFDVVSQMTANASYRLTRWATLRVGYTFLFWAKPVRAGDQFDLVINPLQAGPAPTGPQRPAILFRTDNFWAQGLNTGLELRW